MRCVVAVCVHVYRELQADAVIRSASGA